MFSFKQTDQCKRNNCLFESELSEIKTQVTNDIKPAGKVDETKFQEEEKEPSVLKKKPGKRY